MTENLQNTDYLRRKKVLLMTRISGCDIIIKLSFCLF